MVRDGTNVESGGMLLRTTRQSNVMAVFAGLLARSL